MMKFWIGAAILYGGCYFFCPALFPVLLIGTGIVLAVLIFWACVCYGISMIRLFFKI